MQGGVGEAMISAKAQRELLWKYYLEAGEDKPKALDMAMEDPELSGVKRKSLYNSLRRLEERGGVSKVEKHEWSLREEKALWDLYKNRGEETIFAIARAAIKFPMFKGLSSHQVNGKLDSMIRAGGKTRAGTAAARQWAGDDWRLQDIGKHNLELADQILCELDELAHQKREAVQC